VTGTILAGNTGAKIKGLENAGANVNLAKATAQLITGITAAGIGSVASGGTTAGAATAFNSDANNRQLHQTEIQWIKQNVKRYAQQQGISEADAEKRLAEQAFRQVQFGAEGGASAWDAQASRFLKQAGNQPLPGDSNVPGQNVGHMFYATPEQRANANMYLASTAAYADFYKQNGLQQPTPEQLTQAAQRNGQILANLNTATKVAAGASAAIALGGLTPILLQWALNNPIAATQAGVISAETAAAIVSGAVTPSGLLQQVSNPQAARIVYNRLAAAATQNVESAEVVLGRYIAGSANSYERVAQARGVTYYEVAAWSAIDKELGSKEKMWEINKAFLDKAIAEGKSFVFTSDPTLIIKNAPESASATKEVNHLISKGFTFKEKEGLWHGAKK
jgi:filamentous hemagglutinin